MHTVSNYQIPSRLGHAFHTNYMNITTNSHHDDSLLAVLCVCCRHVELIVKMIVREVSQLQRICYLRDCRHVSSIDVLQQQLSAFPRHMIMWSIDAWYCSRLQLQLGEEMGHVFQLWSCARLDKALVYMIVIFPYTVQRPRLCLKFDKVAN